LPAASVAVTEKAYVPSARPVNAFGEVQAAAVPVVLPGPSRRQDNVEPVSVEVNANEGAELFVGPDGPDVIVVSGAVASTVKDRVAGVGSVLPAESVAATERLYAPSARVLNVFGEVQAAAVPVVLPGPSRVQAKDAPLSALNPNVGVASLVNPDGPESMVVSGVLVSTVNEPVAAVGSALPAASVAVTEKVYVPSTRSLNASGEVQAVAVPVAVPGPSSRHEKVEADSDEVKANDGALLLVAPDGPEVIVVSGAAESTVNDRVAGLGSGLPVASVAVTEKVYVPSARPL
jgi:hypothetical protein